MGPKAQAVVIYHNQPTTKDSQGRLWFRNVIDSPWPNKNQTDELHESLQEKLDKHGRLKENAAAPNKFFVLQGILTPDGELIKKEILENSATETSIQSIARRVSDKVVDWVSEEWSQVHHNVVIVDFFEDCTMVPAILNLNKP